MPYSQLSDLPPAVKKLPEHAQKIWMGAFNGAYSQYKGDEQKAFATAWAAVAKWRGESLHPKFNRIKELFIKQHGQEEGLTRFEGFLSSNNLDPTKDYNPTSQYRESYEWTTPLIQFYKQDSEAKYYLVTALTANVSMNNNDYTDFNKMMKAAESLSWRPVNINHNHTQWVDFPRTRVDFSKANANEYSVECTLRVDNKDKALQNKLDNGLILHPSIEARGNLEGGYNFTALALLEKGVELPGDPLTEIVPLFLNESVGKSVCRLIDGKMVCECEKEVKEKMSESPENNVELSKLKAEISALKLQVYNLKEENDALKAGKKTDDSNLERQRLESTKRLEAANTENAKLEAVNTEKDKRIKIVEEKNDNLTHQISEMMLEKQTIANEHIKDVAKVQKLLTEALESRDQYKVLSEKLSVTHEENVKKNQRLLEESIQNNNQVADVTEKLLIAQNELKRLQEKIQKAQRFQNWAYRELKQAGVAIVESS
jgi:cation transport regulator ChaB